MKGKAVTRTARIVQRPAVGWFSLRLMVRAGIKTLVSAATGARTARREVLAALDLVRQYGRQADQIWPAAAEAGADGATVAAVIAGDLHHYARHHAGKDGGKDTCQYITCAGGGAFMLGTYSVPQEVRVFDGETATMSATFPSRDASKAIRMGVYKLVYRHKIFCAALAAVLFGLVWVFQAASHVMHLTGPARLLGANGTGETALDMLQSTIRTWDGLIDFWQVLLKAMIYSPLVSLISFGIAAGFVAFAASGRSVRSPNWAAPVAGVLHFMVQICIAFLVAAALRAFLEPVRPFILLYVVLMIVLGLFLGWFVCGNLFALYLRLANAATGLHEQELYSSQAIEDWKFFLRMRVAADGATIYPIGLRNVVHDWCPAPGYGPDAPDAGAKGGGAKGGGRLMEALRAPVTNFDVPDGASHLLEPVTPLSPELIEKPIFIPATKGVLA